MRIFLSGMETNSDLIWKSNTQIPCGLVSFYYIQKSKKAMGAFKQALKHCDYLLVDSGAHTFQLGTKVDWEKFTNDYANFIKKYDCPKIIGFFEMDVDVQIGYARVLELRKILLKATNKIIPVWHKNRGIPEFKKMCRETKGDIVAITGFKNEDIEDDQYPAFVKYAWRCGKKIHCLGMTRQKILNKIPFNYVDSASWKLSATYGNLLKWNNAKHKLKTVNAPKGKLTTSIMFVNNLKESLKMFSYFNRKWHKVNNDLYIGGN